MSDVADMGNASTIERLDRQHGGRYDPMITSILAGWSTVARAMDRAPTLATALRRTRVTAAGPSRKSAIEIAAAALDGASANDDGEARSAPVRWDSLAPSLAGDEGDEEPLLPVARHAVPAVDVDVTLFENEVVLRRFCDVTMGDRRVVVDLVGRYSDRRRHLGARIVSFRPNRKPMRLDLPLKSLRAVGIGLIQLDGEVERLLKETRR